MKARQFKNGNWTISEITTDELVALSKVLTFARNAEYAFGWHPEEERQAIKTLREDGDTLSNAATWEFFARCLKKDIERNK